MVMSAATSGSVRAVRERVTSPEELRRAVPGSAAAAVTSLRGRSAARRILNGVDDRLLVVVGPCSLHDRESTLEYAERLKGVAEDLSDDLSVIMRAYVEKPRTSFGWPGLAHAPDLLGPPDPERGIRLARSILADITGLGLPVAVEWLTVFGPAYFEDLVSWGCIGARTVEDPTHRSMAGALAMPIGMKNRTDGAIDVAVNAIRVAEREQAVLTLAPDGSAAVTRTSGNPDCHLVLRGGSSGPNHHPSAVRGALRLLNAVGLPGRLLVDASHDNCAKDHELQRAVAEEVGRQVGAGNTAIRGVMLDRRLCAELLDDPKEVYEHIVSVKVAYDELHRVCAPGTVTVTDLMTVKPRGTVQHLGSRVRGELDADRSSWDALEAVFPAVTGSGMPKAAACEYISRTEPHPRGLYGGAILTATQDGALDAGLVLRSLFDEGGRRWLRAGAGIVGSSDPHREYEETCQKLRSIASSLTG